MLSKNLIVTGLLSLGIGIAVAQHTEATAYYVAPTGTGSYCTRSTPCSLTTGLKTAGSGDEVVLLDGRYTGSFLTQHDGVTIRAENRHGATLGGGAYYLFRIQHSNITVRGVQFDGERVGNTLEIIDSAGIKSNIVIEDNIMKNAQGPGIGVGGMGTRYDITNVTIRQNLIDSTGYRNVGEGLYIGASPSKGGKGLVTNVQIYGNTIRSYTCDGIDAHENASKLDVHHNIFNTQVRNSGACNPDTGITSQGGSGNMFHDNIIRYSDWMGIAPIRVTAGGGHKVWRNVFYNLSNQGDGIRVYVGSATNNVPTEIYNNTFCNLLKYSVRFESALSVQPKSMITASTNLRVYATRKSLAS